MWNEFEVKLIRTENHQAKWIMLNLSFIMLKNGQTYFKNVAVLTTQDVYVRVVIFQQHERKG